MKKNIYQWDFSQLLVDFKKEEKNIILAHKNFSNKWRKRIDYLSDVNVLKIALNEYESLNKNYRGGGAQGFYYGLLRSLNQNDPKIIALDNKISDLIVENDNLLAFFELNLKKINLKKQAEFLQSSLLIPYKNFLEKIFKAGIYALGEEGEKILHLKSATSRDNWIMMLSSFLAKAEKLVLEKGGKKVKKNFSEISNLLNDKNKKVRDSAAKAFNEILLDNLDVAEREINSVLADKKIDDNLRGFKKAEESRLLRDDVGEKMINSLLLSVKENFGISRRFYKLKARALNLKKLAYHEKNLVVGDIKNNYTYNQSVSFLEKTLTGLDQEFLDVFRGLVNKKLIDVYPKKGKTSGAFCANHRLVDPTYIMLNHDNDLRGVLTLAHEVGHGINAELMKKNSNSLNFGSSLATAEVASTFFENFVFDELKNSLGEKDRFNLLMYKLNNYVSGIFRQIALYLFERELNEVFREKGYLSAKEIGVMFKKYMSAYLGDSVEQSAGAENWWVYWSHIRSFFYVYSYASGDLISAYLQENVKKDKKFLEKVKKFLSSGLERSPEDIFKELGININSKNFWLDGLNSIENDLVEAERLFKKIK